MSTTQAQLGAATRSGPDLLKVGAYASAALLALSAGLVVFYAPDDAVQGVVQKIFYLHVPAAIAAYVAFAMVLVGGLVYLWNESPAADRIARAAAEVGLVFTTLTLVMGSIWAKPIWGTWWVWWDPRLVATLVLWMIYAGYLLMRRIATPGRQAARFGAVVGIIGFIDVPITHFSVTWWRTIHPPLETAAPANLPPEMLVTFAVSSIAVLLFALVLVGYRYRLETASDRLAEAVDR
ncbi:MAG TPA: cytochrome c biogenesis protein CcsA [Candidatus Dormibacteraeota bacterium]|nr:cytochrome c biogenesis protein CcsA [Candidatus Dormibacteraeota bacterium]